MFHTIITIITIALPMYTIVPLHITELVSHSTTELAAFTNDLHQTYARATHSFTLKICDCTIKVVEFHIVDTQTFNSTQYHYKARYIS